MPVSRTKLYLSLFYLATLPIVYFGYRPRADRDFALGCWLVLGVVLLLCLAWVRVIYCPRCDYDTGYFDNYHAWYPKSRYVVCRRCGCLMDRARHGEEVAR